MSFLDLYADHWPQLVKLLRREPRLSPPLLIDSADRLANQPLRLFVVGQQTNSWYNDEVPIRKSPRAIEALQAIYADFSLGLTHPSPFWQAVRELEHGLGVEPGHVLWGNLNRADFEAGRPPSELEAEMLRVFPLLPEELSAASPDLVVFFTGPAYDGLLSTALPDAVITPVRGFGRALAEVRHSSLPMRSFRAYHPKYLRLSGAWKKVLGAVVRRARDR